MRHCRAANGTPYWTKNGADCNQGDEVLDGQAREVSGGGCYRGKCANVGDVVLFNADGTTTVIRNPTPEQRAIGQARIVVNATVEVTGSTAADVATSGSGMVTTAAEMVTPTGGSPTLSWKQTFTFDRYGNRSFDEASTTTLPRGCVEAGNPVVCESVRPVVNPSVNPLNNRFSTGQGWGYDAAGNVTADPQGRQFTYDAENKQVKVESVDFNGNPVNTLGVYFYDGDGKRVKKIVPGTGEVTVFVYDAASKLVAEYLTVVQPIQDAKVAYLTNDHLGSPRINTDANGNVTARHDYHPFGEEIGTLAALPGSPQPRTATLGYTTDTIRKQFTGYERDSEINLDFAEARYYNPMRGRFKSPDPLLASAMRGNPQSWNRYAYAANNPLVITDPTGLKWYYNSAEDRYKWYGDNDKVDDGFVPVVGTVGADERGVGSFVYETENGWVRLNPYENSFAIFDTREAARGDFESVYQCNCQGLAETIADESVRKVTTVGIAAGVAVAVGTGAGVAMAATGTAVGGTVTTLGLTGTGTAATTTAATAATTAAASQSSSVVGNAITGFTKHGINSAISHDGVGVSTRAILNTLKEPVKIIAQSEGRLRIVGKDAVIVLNQAGKVITTWSRNSRVNRVR